MEYRKVDAFTLEVTNVKTKTHKILYTRKAIEKEIETQTSLLNESTASRTADINYYNSLLAEMDKLGIV